ncbi:hypothetical protein BASA81_007986 [Batrachochytrium salamandrivorans]|nr:hypothetical protein BASA81_007986 [Batrachochytrium salamandrivorans]
MLAQFGLLADSVLTGLLANWELKEDTGDLVSASTDLESMVKTIASMTVPAYIYCAKRTSFVVDVTFSLVGGVLSHVFQFLCPLNLPLLFGRKCFDVQHTIS